jgi:N-ethylmaleimide reductase
MVTHARSALFSPVQIGAITLKHRIVMPPLSRLRAQWPSGAPSDLNLEYYSQRASDGGLIFTEATAISATGRGYRGAPGIYSDEQVAGWKRVTDAVHAKGGRMFVQLWHAGRTTHIATTGEKPVTASVDPTYWADPEMLVVTPDGFSQPSPHRALEIAEIVGIIEQYRAAAANAKRAGFDGVELMAANGHLIDRGRAGVGPDLQGSDHCGRRLRARHGGGRRRQRRRQPHRVRPPIHRQPGPAEAHQARPAAQSL